MFDDFRSRSLESRIYGLLYYDFLLAAESIGIKCKIEDFMLYLNETLETNYKKPYTEKKKKPLRDDLKLASQCVSEMKVLRTKVRREIKRPPKINLPLHVPFYYEFAFFQQKQHNKKILNKFRFYTFSYY